MRGYIEEGSIWNDNPAARLRVLNPLRRELVVPWIDTDDVRGFPRILVLVVDYG